MEARISLQTQKFAQDGNMTLRDLNFADKPYPWGDIIHYPVI